MKYKTTSFSIITTLILSLTIGHAQEVTPKETVVAVVDDKEITLGHLLSLASRLPEEYLTVPAEDLYKGILKQLIQQELLTGLIDEESPVLRLAVENEINALYASEAVAQIYKNAASDENIKKHYTDVYLTADLEPEFKASHILVETEKEADALVKELKDGADFAELAKEKSTGPSGENGGDLGWFGIGQMVPEFETAVLELQAGQISEPVKTQFGWHVIKLLEKRDQPVQPLEVVRAEIEEDLKKAALESKLRELEINAKVYRPEVDFDYEIITEFDLLKD